MSSRGGSRTNKRKLQSCTLNIGLLAVLESNRFELA
jgi:hypothetical protein